MIKISLNSDAIGYINRLRQYAEKFENWSVVRNDSVELNAFSVQSGSADVEGCYAMVIHEGDLLRYMKIRATGLDLLDSPEIMFTIAHMLGYTGAQCVNGQVEDPPDSWLFSPGSTDNSFIVQQKVMEVFSA